MKNGINSQWNNTFQTDFTPKTLFIGRGWDPISSCVFHPFFPLFPIPTNEISPQYHYGYWTHMWVEESGADDHSLRQIVKSIGTVRVCVCVWQCFRAAEWVGERWEKNENWGSGATFWQHQRTVTQAPSHTCARSVAPLSCPYTCTHTYTHACMCSVQTE